MTFKDCNSLGKGLRCFPVICLLHNNMGIQLLCIITTEIWVISRRQSVNQHVTEEFPPKGAVIFGTFYSNKSLFKYLGRAWKWWTFPMQTAICTQYHHVKGKNIWKISVFMSIATPNYIQKHWSIGWFLASQVMDSHLRLIWSAKVCLQPALQTHFPIVPTPAHACCFRSTV